MSYPQSTAPNLLSNKTYMFDTLDHIVIFGSLIFILLCIFIIVSIVCFAKLHPIYFIKKQHTNQESSGYIELSHIALNTNSKQTNQQQQQTAMDQYPNIHQICDTYFQDTTIPNKIPQLPDKDDHNTDDEIIEKIESLMAEEMYDAPQPQIKSHDIITKQTPQNGHNDNFEDEKQGIFLYLDNKKISGESAETVIVKEDVDEEKHVQNVINYRKHDKNLSEFTALSGITYSNLFSPKSAHIRLPSSNHSILEMTMSTTNVSILPESQHEIDEQKYKEWDYEDILQWILSLEHGLFRRYEFVLTRALMDEDVKGKHLEHVDKGDLHRWGIKAFAHKVELYQCIQELVHRQEGYGVLSDPGTDPGDV